MDVPNAKLLLVDDERKNLDVLIEVLEPKGYDILVGINGVVALDLARQFPPDLILLDVMMPELDGFETCKRLKANPGTRDIPVIFLTAKVETEDIVRGFELGAVDYVLKPFNSTELLARVETQLSLYHLRRRLEELVEERTAQLQHRVRELDGRDRLMHLQMSAPSLPTVDETILQVVEQVLKVRQAAIYRLNEPGDRLEIVAALGLSGTGVLQTGEALQGEEGIGLEDTDSPIAQTFADHKPRTGKGQEGIVPILFGETALGVLWVDTLDQAELDRQMELDSLWRLAQEAALTLRAAQVAQDLEMGEIDVSGLLGIEE